MYFYQPRLFLDNFPPIQLNWSCQFLSFLEFWLEFFQDFAWFLSFFMSFWEISKKCKYFIIFSKYLMIKRLFLGVPLSFPPKSWVFIQFSTNSTQLELPFFEFFWNFGLSFFKILLEFWVFSWVFGNIWKKCRYFLIFENIGW